MTPETVVVLVVVILGSLLGIWGASLVVRALASRASTIAMRLARRIPKRINTAPPTLSRLQFWFGMIVGPIVSVAGVTLVAFVLGLVTLEGDIKISWSAIPAVFVAMLAMGMLVVGLRWDRARGRRRCPTCWYDYAGLSDRTPCPECGEVPASERSLARTRRNRTLIRLAPVMLLLAWVAYMVPSLMRSGWRAMIPTTVLIAGFEHFPDSALFSRTFMDDSTLSARVWQGDATAAQKQWLMNRSLRLLTTSKEPRTLALAGMFLNMSPYFSLEGDGGVTDEALDEANANMLETMFRVAGDTSEGTYVQAMAGQSFMSHGPRTRAMVAAHIDEILPVYTGAASPMDRMVWAGLIARLAPATPKVVEAARKVAFDPTITDETHEVACVALGILAARDPALKSAIEAEYAATGLGGSNGGNRAALATALAVSGFDPDPVARFYYQMNKDPASVARTESIKRQLASEDADLRLGAIAAIRGSVRIAGYTLDWDALKEPLRSVMRKDAGARAQAFATLSWIGGVDSAIVPELAELARDGDATSLKLLADACSRMPIDENWRPLLDAARERNADPGIDQDSRAALDRLELMLGQYLPQ